MPTTKLTSQLINYWLTDLLIKIHSDTKLENFIFPHTTKRVNALKIYMIP